MRTACLRVPDLPLAAALRSQPELAGRPLAIAAGSGPRAEILAASPEACARGVRAWSTVPHARAVCGELVVRVRSPELERAARAALLDVAVSVSPRAALAPPATGARAAEVSVFLDARGTASLFRSESGLATALAERAQRVGLAGTVGVASSRGVARIAARCLDEPGACRVLAPDAERAFLDPLPVDVLDPDDALAEALTRFGVRRVRDLLRLPRAALADRLGPGALRLADRARGLEHETPLPVPSAARLVESADLEHPIERLEALAFALQGVLSRLLARLEIRHLACGDLGLLLHLDGGRRDSRRVGVSAPTQDLRVLVRLLCHALEARPPEAAVLGAQIDTEGCSLRPDQLDLFRPAGPAPAALGRTLAELEALCGSGQVGAPEVADSHHPDDFGLAPFRVAGRSRPAPSDAPSPDAPVLALRALRPPAPAEVRLAGGRPVWLRSAVSRGAIVHAAGPWRTTGGWWSRERRFAFDHYDIQTEDGSVLRIRFDYVRRAWHVDAVYD